MKKNQIIKKQTEFTNMINNCPYYKNKYLIIYYHQNQTKNRYGITIPKKTGKAVIRNKIKRRMKDIIDKNEKKIPIYYDYVIISRKSAIELTYQEIEYNLIKLINKIGEKNEK